LQLSTFGFQVAAGATFHPNEHLKFAQPVPQASCTETPQRGSRCQASHLSKTAYFARILGRVAGARTGAKRTSYRPRNPQAAPVPCGYHCG